MKGMRKGLLPCAAYRTMTTAATKHWLDWSFCVAPEGEGIGVLGGPRGRADRANLDPTWEPKTMRIRPLQSQISGPILGPFCDPKIGVAKWGSAH